MPYALEELYSLEIQRQPEKHLPGMADNPADGRIVDPVVIGQAGSISTTSTPVAAASSGGGGGGCALGMGATPADMLSLAAPLLFLLRLKRRR